ncbi:Branched-chain amino acid transport [human gut metagenome]|uniref:Branched-chain amino acid transport n=1 Tax=human gut metagenome TaxID=408170 RepID=K1TW54_9ZZZZ
MLHSVAIIAVAAIVTLIIRAVPFVAFDGKREVPETVTYLGKVLPPAIMVILVIYCVKGINLFTGSHGIPELLSIAVVAFSSDLEEKYVAEYSCRDHTLYDISASSILKQC